MKKSDNFADKHRFVLVLPLMLLFQLRVKFGVMRGKYNTREVYVGLGGKVKQGLYGEMYADLSKRYCLEGSGQ